MDGSDSTSVPRGGRDASWSERDVLVKIARSYLRRGWSVVPIIPGDKRALTPWRQFQERKPTDEELEEWWASPTDRGIGIVTGAISDLVVIDIDGDGDRTWEGLVSAHGGIAKTVEVITPHGLHLYFRHPGVRIPNSAGKLGVGVDVRGDGGYVVAPPSVGRDGGSYGFVPHHSPGDLTIAEMPAWLLDPLRDRDEGHVLPQGAQPSVQRDADGVSAYGRKALQEEAERVRTAPEGTRNDSLNTAAFAMGQLIGGGELREDLVREALGAAASVAGLEPREIETTIASGIGAGIKQPRQRPATGETSNERAPSSPSSRSGNDRPGQTSRLATGGAFLFDGDELDDAPLWGRLASKGESLMLVGPIGVGKTTLAGNLVLARIGLRESNILGFPMEPSEGRILYLALDRPRQIRRAIRRMVIPEERAHLDDRIRFWKGPLPFDVGREPDRLLPFLRELVPDVDMVVVDSLKDIAIGLSTDEIGAAYNRARQHVLLDGIEMIEPHHQRKASADNPKPKGLDDVYGSRWLTAGAGSVVLLWGSAGDAVVELSHLKPPQVPVDPFLIEIDHARGIVTSAAAGEDALTIVRASGGGLTARAVGERLYGRANTDQKQKSNEVRARRQLEDLVDRGLLAKRIPDEETRGAIHAPALYLATPPTLSF